MPLDLIGIRLSSLLVWGPCGMQDLVALNTYLTRSVVGSYTEQDPLEEHVWSQMRHALSMTAPHKMGDGNVPENQMFLIPSILG